MYVCLPWTCRAEHTFLCTLMSSGALTTSSFTHIPLLTALRGRSLYQIEHWLCNCDHRFYEYRRIQHSHFFYYPHAYVFCWVTVYTYFELQEPLHYQNVQQMWTKRSSATREKGQCSQLVKARKPEDTTNKFVQWRTGKYWRLSLLSVYVIGNTIHVTMYLMAL